MTDRSLSLLTGDSATERTVVVASVPAAHPYVQRISNASAVSVLADPPVPGAPADVWWPPVILDPEWILANAHRADLLHIHFGTESFGPGHLAACIAAARRVGWPVVYTAHDLVHPQSSDQTAYHAQLDELIPAVDAVVTLTGSAAAEIRRRWGREAEVIPHPSLLAPDAAAPAVRATDDVRIGVYLKDLRPNVDGPGAVTALVTAVETLRGRGVPAVTEVRMHHRVRDEVARAAVRELCADAAHATLIEHERLSDRELATSLSRLDACVLPYRFGTHSGWLELCWDLGVPLAAPDVGFYAEQHGDDTVATFQEGDPTSLTAALTTLLATPAATRSGSRDRADLVAARHGIRHTSDAVAAGRHADLYRRLLRERAS